MLSAKQMFFQYSMERNFHMFCALLQNLKFFSPCHINLYQ